MPSNESQPQFSTTVTVQYLPEQSQPPEGPFGFAYTVKVSNTGNVAAQLVARQWLITDANGVEEEVRGLAVVGHQPLLQPGESFEYTSWVPLRTPIGHMRGTFYCMTEDARPFEAPIEVFSLAQPGALH